jgi:sugar/nucleoside kinase (ribokinase family)
MVGRAPVVVDIPCDVQQVDSTGFVWAFLDEARDPSLIYEGAIVVSADEIDPVVARVVDLASSGDRTVVHLEILPGDPLDYAHALSRAHIVPASGR